ncbi:MFS transporter [Streptomyces rimosus]|uniref:MFS transporter n=1 Tax=Streptomyces rimosus TaxID=1927 RepID=UPI0031D25163
MALALAVLATALDMTVLNIALPTLAADLHAGTSVLQWFASAYTLTVAAVMLPIGALGDRHGRRKLLLAALVVFAGASVWCAYSGSSAELIAARVALGLGGATIMPLSMAQMPVLFPDARERDRAMAVWIGALALGSALGPLVGGWLLSNFWWGAVFIINVPLALVGIVAVITLVPESRSSTPLPLDLPGTVLSSLGLVGVTYGFIRAGAQGWGDPVVAASLVAGFVALVLFVIWQRRARHALIDLNLFSDAGFRWGTIYSVLNAFAMFGLVFTVPMYFQGVLGTDAFGSGLRLLPMIAGMLVANGSADPLREKLGTRTVLFAGFAITAVGMTLGAFTTTTDGFWYSAMWTALQGAGLGLVMITSTSLALGSLDKERSGVGSALITMLRNAGMTLGPAVLGTVAMTRYHERLGALDTAPVRDSVIAGASVADRLHDTAMLAHVRSAFMSGMSLLLAVCAGICVLSAGLVVMRTRRTVAASPAADERERELQARRAR